MSCPHYSRKCKFISPCCLKIYTCRHCHNESEDHEIDRLGIKEIICSECNFKQKVSNKCENCGINFAKYFCDICNFFDDRIEKNYYHCDKCGICRIMGSNKFFHCDFCGCCVCEDNHKCKENMMQQDCPICLENLFFSIKKSTLLPCQHMVHVDCINLSIENDNITCPMCRKIIFEGENLKKYIESIDELVKNNPYKEDITLQIYCNDCFWKGESKYNPFGIKCGECGGYNTSK